MTQFGRGGLWSSTPPVTKTLILINIAVWLLEALVPQLQAWLTEFAALHFWGSPAFNPIQPVSYMFLHDPKSIFHLLFNMFMLWMFGRALEQTWGERRFLVFYLVCGIGGGLVQEVVWQLSWLHDYASALAPSNGLTQGHMENIVRQALEAGDPDALASAALLKSSFVTLGASGAIFGILLGFAFTFPNLPLYLFFIPVPIKAKYMVAGYAIIEFFLGVSGSQSTVAHFAHLGGMLFGLVLLLWWNNGGGLRRRIRQLRSGQGGAYGGPTHFGSGTIDVSKLEERRRLNELLDKIRLSGYASLTQAERDELRRLSDRIR